MELRDFFPSYVPRSNPTLISDLYKRTELNTYKLGPVEKIPDKAGQLLNTQEILRRIMSPYTPYPHLLVDHGMGTGKTCTSVSIAEAWLAFRDRLSKLASIGAAQIVIPKRAVFVLVKSDRIRDNFVRDLANTCTDGRYQPPEDPNMTDKKLKIRTKKLYSENYEIATFETFSRVIQHNIHKPDFVERYSNRLIIIDEAHNLHPTSITAGIYAEYDRVVRESGLDVSLLRAVANSSEKHLENYLEGGVLYPHYEALTNLIAESTQKEPLDKVVNAYADANLTGLADRRNRVVETLITYLKSGVEPHDTLNMYGRIHTFLHEIRNPRILLLTGTPMVDQASEIIDLFNLIMPLDAQLSKEADLDSQISKVVGMTSYLEQMVTDVKRVDIGTANYTKHVKVVELPMSAHQEAGYAAAYKLDAGNKDGVEDESGASVAWLNTRQASNFVFPDGSYGKKGFEYIQKNASFKRDVVDRLGDYSAKLKFIMDELKKLPDECAFIFCRDVEGGGVNTLKAVFDAHGWTEATGKEVKAGNRYAVITGSTKNIPALLRVYNSPENYDGSRIRVIIGSEAAAEALSFYHTTRVFLYTPMWNTSKLEQAIYRAIRVGSHNILKMKLAEKDDRRQLSVRIYRLATVPQDRARYPDVSIEVHMYKVAEEKDIEIMKVQRILKETAIDCELFKGRNLLEQDVDGSRKCNYTTCEYSCQTQPSKLKNQNTYTIYYSTDLQSKIHDHVMEQLATTFQVDLQDLYSRYSEHPRVVDIAITNILNRYVTLKIGIYEYKLVLVGSTISLVPVQDLSRISTDLVAYTANPLLQVQITMTDLIRKQNSRKDSLILKTFYNTQDTTLLDQISDTTLVQLLKGLLLQKNNLGPVGNLIKKHYEGAVNLDQNTFRVGDNTYHLDGEKIELVKKEKKVATSVKVTEQMRREKGDYFGYIKDGLLYILDYTQKSSRGRSCGSYDSKYLLPLLAKLGVEPDFPVDTDDREELARRLKEHKINLFEIDLTTKQEEYKKYTSKQLQTMLTHVKTSKTSVKPGAKTICRLLIEAMKTKGVLLPYE